MKKNRVNKKVPLLMLLPLLILISASHAHQTNEVKTRAEEFYMEGMDAVNKANWSLALEKFKQSYNLYPHSLTAYLISCAYLKIENASKAKEYADKATIEEPELEEPFLTDAKKIMDWATKAINNNPYKLSGKADDGTRPQSPKINPPEPSLPQKRALGQDTPVKGDNRLPKKIERGPEVHLSSPNLSGIWKCNDGGIYFIRQIDNELWWYGQRKDGAKTWGNVFYGYIKGNHVTGKWADVSHGLPQSSGLMTIQILGNNRLEAIRKTGGFGGNRWIR